MKSIKLIIIIRRRRKKSCLPSLLSPPFWGVWDKTKQKWEKGREMDECGHNQS